MDGRSTALLAGGAELEKAHGGGAHGIIAGGGLGRLDARGGLHHAGNQRTIRRRREGAGRKPSEHRMQEYRVTLPPEVADYIRTLGKPTMHEAGPAISRRHPQAGEWYRPSADKRGYL